MTCCFSSKPVDESISYIVSIGILNVYYAKYFDRLVIVIYLYTMCTYRESSLTDTNQINVQFTRLPITAK